MVASAVALLLLCVAAPLRVAGDEDGGTKPATESKSEAEERAWLKEASTIKGAWNEKAKNVVYESECEDDPEDICGLLCPAVLRKDRTARMKDALGSNGGACTKAEETQHPYLQIAIRGILCGDDRDHSLDFTWTQGEKSSVWMKPDGIRTRQVLSLIYVKLKNVIKDQVSNFTLCLATGGFAPSLDLEGGTRMRVHVIGATYDQLKAADYRDNYGELQKVLKRKIENYFKDKGGHMKDILIKVHKKDPLRFAEISLPKTT